QLPVGGVQGRTDLYRHGALGDRLAVGEVPPRSMLGNQVEILLTDGADRVHIRGGVDRDLVAVRDAQRGPGTVFGGLDVGDPANGVAPVGHVRCLVQTAGCR